MKASEPATVLTRWPLEGGGCVEVLRTSEPERRFAPHWHAEWSFGAVLAGECRFSCEGQALRAAAGDLVVMAPHALHTAGVSAGVFRMVMVYVPADWLAARCGWPCGKVPVIGGVRADGAFARRLEREAAQPGPEGLLAAIAGLAQQLAADAGQWRDAAPAREPRVERLCELLQQDAPLDLARLAADLGMSREHLHRLFRRALGLPPLAYARLARLARAKQMLDRGEPAAAVAAECGFADQAHFSRWFRRCLGAPPSAYRPQPVRQGGAGRL